MCVKSVLLLLVRLQDKADHHLLIPREPTAPAAPSDPFSMLSSCCRSIFSSSCPQDVVPEMYRCFQAVFFFLVWSLCFWGSPVVFISCWTLSLLSAEIFSWLLASSHTLRPPGFSSSSVFFFAKESKICLNNSSVLHRSSSLSSLEAPLLFLSL